MTDKKEAVQQAPAAKKNAPSNIFDVFIEGARKGWALATGNLVPNVLMAFVLAYILNILGVMAFIGKWCGPVMALFGLPGEALIVLLTVWLSCSAGVGVAASMFASGILNETHITILMPALILMASQIQYMGRLLGLADISKKYWPMLMGISILNAVIGMEIMHLYVLFF